MERKTLTLADLGCGAAEEMFSDAVQALADNIADLNTSDKATRSISLAIKVKPNEHRTIGSMTVDVKTTLAPIKPHATTVYFGKIDGQMSIVEDNPMQDTLFDQPAVADPSKVVDMEARKEASQL